MRLFIQRWLQRTLASLAEGFDGLDGMCVLAINQVYFESAFVQSALGIQNYDLFEKHLKASKNIQALILFQDDFSSESSFAFKNCL
jgi:hypothetical protein